MRKIPGLEAAADKPTSLPPHQSAVSQSHPQITSSDDQEVNQELITTGYPLHLYRSLTSPHVHAVVMRAGRTVKAINGRGWMGGSYVKIVMAW